MQLYTYSGRVSVLTCFVNKLVIVRLKHRTKCTGALSRKMHLNPLANTGLPNTRHRWGATIRHEMPSCIPFGKSRGCSYILRQWQTGLWCKWCSRVTMPLLGEERDKKNENQITAIENVYSQAKNEITRLQIRKTYLFLTLFYQLDSNGSFSRRRQGLFKEAWFHVGATKLIRLNGNKVQPHSNFLQHAA